MTLESLLKNETFTLVAGGGLLALGLSLIQISPIKINPWTAIGKLLKKLLNSLGRATNGDVLVKLDEVTHAQKEAQKNWKNWRFA